MITERLIFTKPPSPWVPFLQGAACGLVIGLTCFVAGLFAGVSP